MHVNVLACGIFGSVSGSSAATCATVAKIALPELKKRGYDEMRQPRLARRRRHARHPHSAVDHHGGLCGAAPTSRSSRCSSRGFLPGLLVMALYSGYIVVWSLLNPDKTPPRRSADAVPREAARVGASSFPACC